MIAVRPTFAEVRLWPDAARHLGTMAGRPALAPSLPLRAIYRLSVHSRDEVTLDEAAALERFRAIGTLTYNSHIAAALLDRAVYLRARRRHRPTRCPCACCAGRAAAGARRAGRPGRGELLSDAGLRRLRPHASACLSLPGRSPSARDRRRARRGGRRGLGARQLMRRSADRPLRGRPSRAASCGGGGRRAGRFLVEGGRARDPAARPGRRRRAAGLPLPRRRPGGRAAPARHARARTPTPPSRPRARWPYRRSGRASASAGMRQVDAVATPTAARHARCWPTTSPPCAWEPAAASRRCPACRTSHLCEDAADGLGQDLSGLAALPLAPPEGGRTRALSRPAPAPLRRLYLLA